MKDRIIYVELKSGYAGNGPAWIGRAAASKSGTTVYSNGKAFRRSKGGNVGGNHYDVETGEEYWISGVKKDNQDRHRSGGGDILIDHSVIDAYLAETGRDALPANLKPAELAPSVQSNAQAAGEHEKL